jgi:8-oxo-dGTP pyrophosphatase MutT (NUDIX family)
VADGAGPLSRQAARIIVRDASACILLFRGGDPTRPELGTWWFTPGGGVEGDETVEAAARRELWEETGFWADELGDVVFRRDVEFDFAGVSYRQSEVFFAVALSEAARVSSSRWTELERQSIVESRWWPVSELVTAGVVVHPAELGEVVGSIEAWGTAVAG